MDGPSQLHRAIRRARRREIVGRVADAWLYSALAVAVVFLIVILESSWYAPLPLIALTFVAVVIVIGTTHLLSPRLDGFSVASRLDDRNRTSELLATAVTASRSDEAWSRSILAQAEHATTRLEYPSPLGRHSPRAHLAVAAVVIAMALVTSLLAPASHVDHNAGTGQIAAVDGFDPADPSRVGSAFRKPAEAGSEMPFDVSTDTRPDASASGNSDTRSDPTGSDTDGAGRSNTGRNVTLISAHNPPDLTDAATFIRATGSGQENVNATSGSSESTGTSDAVAKQSAAPWQSDRWNASREAAMQAVSAVELPQDRRTLVRAYFDR